MKCDELEDYSILDIEAIDDERYKKEKAPGKWVPESRVYLKTDVDSAIDELKREHHNERHEYIEMVAQLKAELVEQESENRRLKRALWLARAEKAKETQFLWQVYCHCDKLYFCKPFCVSTRKNPYRHISRMNVVEWDEFWGKIKNKCLAKAKEYK